MGTTTIQLKELTKQKLDRIKNTFESRLNKKLTYDETILLIIETSNNNFNQKQISIKNLFGSIKGDVTNFVALRQEGETRLENISKNN
jgi:hypothetical protein